MKHLAPRQHRRFRRTPKDYNPQLAATGYQRYETETGMIIEIDPFPPELQAEIMRRIGKWVPVSDAGKQAVSGESGENPDCLSAIPEIQSLSAGYGIAGATIGAVLMGAACGSAFGHLGSLVVASIAGVTCLIVAWLDEDWRKHFEMAAKQEPSERKQNS
jgi:hypothetical protein